MWSYIRCLAPAALMVLLAGCPPTERLVLLPTSEAARTPPPIREACVLTEQRCSKCHDLERIKVAHHALVDWPMYVDKMRRQPGSGISQEDGKVIVSCLLHLRERQMAAD